MKKIISIVVTISLVIALLSIANYFFVFLPQKEHQREMEIKKVEEKLSILEKRSKEPEIIYDTSRSQDELESISNFIEEERRDDQMEENCGSTGGRYQGNGTCVY